MRLSLTKSELRAEKRKKGYSDDAAEGTGSSVDDDIDYGLSPSDKMGEVVGKTVGAPASRFHTLAKGVKIEPMLTRAESESK